MAGEKRINNRHDVVLLPLSPPIEEIKSSLAAVNISGYVEDTLWNALTSRGAYQVNDGSGNIWVVTSKDPPAKGAKVNVTGTVSPAFTLGDRTLGTVINETKRN